MGFKEMLNEYVLSLEQDTALPANQPQQQDASQPVSQQVPVPMPKTKQTTQPVAPEGYVEMVRLLAKALVMNVPPESIDQLFSSDINKENAEAVAQGLQDLIKTSGNHEDNPERVENIHFQDFYNSINENNFYNKLKHIISVMKKYSNDVDITTSK
jgi:hypothetical protein